MSRSGGSTWLGFQRLRGLKARSIFPLAFGLIATLVLMSTVSAASLPAIDAAGSGCDPSLGILEAGKNKNSCVELAAIVQPESTQIPQPLTDPTPLPIEDLPKLETSLIVFRLEPSGCVPWELCDGSPLITINAFERMPNESVESVHVRVGDVENVYTGDNATIRVPITEEQGIKVEYWAVSSFKDTESARKVFKTRYLPAPGDQDAMYLFDLIGEDWVGGMPPGSETWLVFPPIDDSLPKVLDQPFSADYLYTTNRYIFLAGHLIASGNAAAPSCPNHGLAANGSATLCGEKAAADEVLVWQNKYNDLIYSASIRENIPARVLKGIIAQETQFWPKTENPREVGLGMFTENGADLVLMWNIPYYLKICQPIYGSVNCSVGYASLTPPMQQILRKEVIDQVGTEEEISLLAATIKASTNQIGQLIPNNTGFPADEQSEYNDLWMISTGNYYAGAGCVSRAINQIANQELDLTWVELVTQMDENCKPAEVYVNRVFGVAE